MIKDDVSSPKYFQMEWLANAGGKGEGRRRYSKLPFHSYSQEACDTWKGSLFKSRAFPPTIGGGISIQELRAMCRTVSLFVEATGCQWISKYLLWINWHTSAAGLFLFTWMKIVMFWFKNKHGIQSFLVILMKRLLRFYHWRLLNSLYSPFTFYTSVLLRCANETELHKCTNKLCSKITTLRCHLFSANLLVNGLQLLLHTRCYAWFFTRNTLRNTTICNLTNLVQNLCRKIF